MPSDRADTTPAAASFAEIGEILRHLPGPEIAAVTKVVERDRQLTKPAGALGRLEGLVEWLAAWQARSEPRCDHPRIAVFVGAHGVAARGVSAYPGDVNRQMVKNFIDGGAAINQLATAIDADLRIYELDLDRPTADFTRAPAMDETRCAHAIAYGMMSAEPGVDVLCPGEMGIGNTTAAAALCLALFGGTAEDWVGAGTGVHGEALRRKTEIVRQGAARHAHLAGNPLQLLAALGGEEFAAIAGAVLAARMGRIPVLLDGYACTAAAAVLYALDRGALDHCQVAHCSAEPGHRRLLERIGKQPLLDLGMRLGEATGGALAVSLLKAACACHNGMATFAQAGVSGATP